MKRVLLFTMMIPILVVLNGCFGSYREIGQEQAEEGFEAICLFHGDTKGWLKSGNPNVQHQCKGCYFHFHPNDDTVYTWFIAEPGAGYGTIISGHIAENVRDSVFILADRKPVDSIFGHYQNVPLPFDSTSFYWGRPKEPTNYNDVWEMLLESPIHDFWIINQNTSDVYGPMSFEQYLAKKKDLGVSEKLQLKYEKERLKK